MVELIVVALAGLGVGAVATWLLVRSHLRSQAVAQVAEARAQLAG